jgi:uncharacterized protein (DUF2336 family)
MTKHLTQRDVERLLADPSPDMRAEMAVKVAAELGRRQLTESERQLAESIVRMMARDAALRVRQALAENLKSAPGLPRDVALTLARDVEAVALPILEASLVLTDEDLVDLVRSGSAAKLTAIAKRPAVSRPVADALVDHGTGGVVAALIANRGAELGEDALSRVVDRFGADPGVQEPLVHRPRLPVTVSERLVALVSDRLRDYLVTHHDLPATLASDLVLQSRERATATLFAGTDAGGEADLDRLVAQLHANGRLTPSLLLRALCLGDLAFFEASMSLLADVPLSNVRLLIHDAGRLGLKSLYDRAGLPGGLLPAVRTAINVARETGFDGGPQDRERHRRRMIERILTQHEDMGPDDLDYLLSKLSDLIRPAA